MTPNNMSTVDNGQIWRNKTTETEVMVISSGLTLVTVQNVNTKKSAVLPIKTLVDNFKLTKKRDKS